MCVHRTSLPRDFDPLRLLITPLPDELLRSSATTRVFWSAPDRGLTLAGLGTAEEVAGGRLRDVARRSGGMGALGAHAPPSGGAPEAAYDRTMKAGAGLETVTSPDPAFVVVPFDPRSRMFRRADVDLWQDLDRVRVIVPEVCIVSGPDGSCLIVAWPGESDRRLADRSGRILAFLSENPPTASRRRAAAPTSRPESFRLASSDRAALRDRISRAVAAIQRGEADKVVTAARHTEALDRDADPATVLAHLREAHPGVSCFLIQRSADRAFLGASPERLVAVQGDEIRTAALAGSARRDPVPAVDAALGARLLASAKDRAEHQWVVEALVDALEPLARELTVATEPRLRALADIQHLETPVRARLRHRTHILDLAAILQPTPALGGAPRESALALIRELEPEGRGLYGGAVGWLDGEGNGDLTVAIRCVLLRGREVTAFAGAGIVAESEPGAEVDEIELKLGASLRYLRQ